MKVETVPEGLERRRSVVQSRIRWLFFMSSRKEPDWFWVLVTGACRRRRSMVRRMRRSKRRMAIRVRVSMVMV